MEHEADKILVRRYASELVNKDRMKREVFCQYCNITAFANETEIICMNCGNEMITIVKSVLTGKVITGEK